MREGKEGEEAQVALVWERLFFIKQKTYAPFKRTQIRANTSSLASVGVNGDDGRVGSIML